MEGRPLAVQLFTDGWRFQEKSILNQAPADLRQSRAAQANGSLPAPNETWIRSQAAPR